MSAMENLEAHPLVDLSMWDAGDPWGSVMGEAFSACAYAAEVGADIPESLHYRPGLFGPDPEDLVQWEGSLATPAEVTAYLELLSAALDELRAAGRDY